MAETSQPAAADYRFGPFRIDPAMASLYRGESPVTLRRKSFDVLLYLVRNRGRVVPKDELMSRVWPEVVVTDNSLVQCIKEIREALDDTDQKIVSTAARRGYVFTAPLEALAFELAGLDEGVECQIDAHATGMRQPARDLELIECELRALVASVVTLRAEVHSVCAVGDGRPHGIEGAGGRKEFRDFDRGHASI